MKQARGLKAATTIAGIFIAAAACTSGPTPTGHASPSSFPVASASPTAVASPMPVAQTLCTLPVDRGSGALFPILFPIRSNPNTLPLDDPASTVKLPDGEQRAGLSYDWQIKSWLPVPYKWVADDGAHYVYTDAQSRVHLVAVPGGADEILASGATWGIYSYGTGGIYAGQRDVTKSPSLLGLWMIPLTGGAPEKLSQQGTWLAVDADAAWSVVQDQSTTQAQVPESSYGSMLMRFDLLSRQVTTWYTSASGDFRVATVDHDGLPILVTIPFRPGNREQVLRVTSVGVAKTIASSVSILDVMADAHGVWFADGMMVSIYIVRAAAPEWMGQYGFNGSMKFAGPCQ